MNEKMIFSSIALDEFKEVIKEAMYETLPDYFKDNQQTMHEEEKLLTKSEFKKLTGLSDSTIYRHLRDREMNCVRIGRKQFFKMSSVLNMTEFPEEKKKGGNNV